MATNLRNRNFLKLLDFQPSEIEYQNGTVVRLAEQYGVHTPVNKFIYECILPMERRARDKGPGTRD